jgi:hypothetical protein
MDFANEKESETVLNEAKTTVQTMTSHKGNKIRISHRSKETLFF